MLLSRQHPLIRLARSLHGSKGRREHGLFLAEGANGVQAALSSGSTPLQVLATPDSAPLWLKRAEAVGASLQIASPELLAYAGEAATATSVIAIAPIIAPALALPPSGLILILDGIGDPGNAGTLLRAADAVGVAQVASTAGSVDFFSPKAVRASAGSLWSTALSPLHGKSPEEMAQVLADAQIPIVTAEAHGGSDCFAMAWPARCALVIGHETRGVSEAFSRAAIKTTIPIWGRAESLNAAMAGTLLLYSWRQSSARGELGSVT